MAGNHGGAWHLTSEQAARHRQQAAYGTTAAGAATAAATKWLAARQKRGRDDGSPEPPPRAQEQAPAPIAMQPPPAKRPAAMPSMPPMPPRLTAGVITNVDASTGAVEDNDRDGDEDKNDRHIEPARPQPPPFPPSSGHRPDWLPRGVSEYSQRRNMGATPTEADDPLLSLAHACYGLPPLVAANLAAMGIRSIYPWQKQCLLGGGGALLDGTRSLVYAAPTGGGKSLVADVLLLRQVLRRDDDSLGQHRDHGQHGHRRRRPKALLVLPFVALVQEKVRWLRRVVQDSGVSSSGPSQSSDSLRVVGFFGGTKIRATWADFDIGVATMEKANALINTAIDECTIGDLKVLVLDELHMIDDAHRGYLLEMLATKLLCLDHHVQIVGMSATLNNIELLAQWLGAYSYQTRYRPIPIQEHLVYNGCVYAVDVAEPTLVRATQPEPERLPDRPLRTIAAAGHRELDDPVTNAVVALASETARAGFGALVFAKSRAAAESDALLISRVLPAPAEVWRRDPNVWEARLDLLGELQSLSSAGSGLDTKLCQTVAAGVGFHHAGMTGEERELVARAYDDGVLKVCVATCGLAAGINLPARRVILHGARMGRDLVGPAMLRQMRGRAGRKGKDELGETYLCCRDTDVDDVRDLLHAELPHVTSCLTAVSTNKTSKTSGKASTGTATGTATDTATDTDTDTRLLQRALLEAIAVRLATSRASLDDYVRKTMLYQAATGDHGRGNGDCDGGEGSAAMAEAEAAIWTAVAASLAALEAHGFVEVDAFDQFQPTRFGCAVVASAMSPDDALFVHAELQRALRAFVLDGEMHVLYTFTPVHDAGGGGGVNWLRFWEEMEDLDESGMRVLQILGLKPSVISRMLHGGTLKEDTAEEKETARVYRRFYLALQLRDLCNEMPIHRVAQKYDTPRGAVQNLAQTCEGFAAGMIKFCEHMGWG